MCHVHRGVFLNCFTSRYMLHMNSNHLRFFFKYQDYLFQMPWLHNEGETLHGAEKQKQKRRWKLALYENVWECKGAALPQLWVAFPYSVESFLSKKPLFLKVGTQLFCCSVTFSSRKYSESYQMLLGVQHGTTLSSLVIVQLFPHGGILASLSILRTRKHN